MTIAPITNTDMTHLARLLLATPRQERCELAMDIFANARRAAATTTIAIRNECGNGSISSAVQQYPRKMAPEPHFDNDEYFHCWATAIDVARWEAPLRA